jgi:hypothetical protein
MVVKIEIDPRDITDDNRDSTTDCPVARAIKRALPGADVNVGWQTAYINHRCIKLPSHVQRWIGDMCARNPVVEMGATLRLSE